MLSAAAVEQQSAGLREIDNIVAAMKAYAGSALRKAEETVHNVRTCETSLREAMAIVLHTDKPLDISLDEMTPTED